MYIYIYWRCGGAASVSIVRRKALRRLGTSARGRIQVSICVCVCVCVCVYMYMHIYIYILAARRLFASRCGGRLGDWACRRGGGYRVPYICICTYIYVYMYISIYICMYIYIYMYIYTYVCVCVCVYICTCIYIYIYWRRGGYLHRAAAGV